MKNETNLKVVCIIEHHDLTNENGKMLVWDGKELKYED